MKTNALLALFAASSLAACKAAERSDGEVLASVRAASHPNAELLARLSLAQQEQLLGPPLATSKRVRALVAPNDLTLGPVDAPVVLIAFVDFGVPNGDPVNALLEVQRAHAVDVRIALRPIVGSSVASREAAQAIVAAAAQGKGWELASCASRASSHDSVLGIGGCAATIDLDMQKYAKDLSFTGVALADNAAAAAHLAVARSPTLFLNGYRFKGVPPQDVLERGVKASITHAWALASSERLERGQIYPQLMRTASIPAPALGAADELN